MKECEFRGIGLIGEGIECAVWVCMLAPIRVCAKVRKRRRMLSKQTFVCSRRLASGLTAAASHRRGDLASPPTAGKTEFVKSERPPTREKTQIRVPHMSQPIREWAYPGNKGRNGAALNTPVCVHEKAKDSSAKPR